MTTEPEFSSVTEFIEHQRALIPEQAAAVVAQAVAEFQADGITIPPGTEALLAERVKKMLTARLDAMHISLEAQLKETP